MLHRNEKNAVDMMTRSLLRLHMNEILLSNGYPIEKDYNTDTPRKITDASRPSFVGIPPRYFFARWPTPLVDVDYQQHWARWQHQP